jgi:hypothetical protein
MSIQLIRLTLPFCDVSQEKQTKCSLTSRVVAVGAGVIAILLGVLVLYGISGLSSLGTMGGGLLCTLGALTLLTGACTRCIQERGRQNPENPEKAHNPAGSYSDSLGKRSGDIAVLTTEPNNHQSVEQSVHTPNEGAVHPSLSLYESDLSRSAVELELERINKKWKEFEGFFNKLSKEERLVIKLFYINFKKGLMTSEKKACVKELVGNEFEKIFIDFLRLLISGEQTSLRQEMFGRKRVAALCAQIIFDTVHRKQLLVEATSDDTLNAYVTYNRLILLRPLKFDVLMLGCGLGQCRADEGKRVPPYAHENEDTVDIRLEMNPSVICFWGEASQITFFSDRYIFIYDEGPIIGFIEDKQSFWTACSTALKKVKTGSKSFVVIARHIFDQKPNLSPSPSDYRLVDLDSTLRKTEHHTYSYDKRCYCKV